VNDFDDRREIERLIEELEAASFSRRGLLRGAGAGALGMGLAGFLAACGGGNGGNGKQTKVIPKGQVASQLNFSNWPFYIDKAKPTSLQDFEKKYGTKVKYTEEINDNNEFFGKVRQQLDRGQSGGRDLFVVTDWMANRMIQLGYVQKLDHSVMPNVNKNLANALRHPSFDPNRDYSIPWQSGMTGLIYRKDKVTPKSINDIFDPKLKGKVTMLTEMRDTVGLTMLGMGKNPTTGSLDDAMAALDKVDKANRDGQIRRFTGNDYIKDLPKGDSWLVYGWSGDATGLESDNPNIKYFFPPEGFMLWSDNVQIPVGAPHAYTAELMINWVYDPVEQAKIAAYINYLTPVKGVKAVFAKKDPELAHNPFIFPSDQVLANGHIFRKLQPDEEQQLDSRFEQILGA
jgi:spermidine/putrescine transport system substrate-binding protein